MRILKTFIEPVWYLYGYLKLLLFKPYGIYMCGYLKLLFKQRGVCMDSLLFKTFIQTVCYLCGNLKLLFKQYGVRMSI